MYLGTPTGNFQAPIDLTGLGLSRSKTSYTVKYLPADAILTNVRPGNNFYIGDYDGDGIPDIVTVNETPVSDSGAVELVRQNYLYRGTGNGTFSGVGYILADSNLYQDPTRGGDNIFRDVNRDGMADLCGDRLYLSNGSGFTDAGPPVSACTGGGALVLDINGDRDADFVSTSGSTSTLWVGLGNGNLFAQDSSVAAFGQPLVDTSATTAPAFGSVVADVNGDGLSDIIYWSNTASNNKLYLSNGKGGFASYPFMSTVQLKNGDGSFDFLVGDFSGLGAAEILTFNQNTQQLYMRPYSAATAAHAPVPDLLIAATSPTGAQTQVGYASMPEPTQIYSIDRSAGSGYPDLLVAFPTPLVEVVTRDMGGQNPPATSEFRYTNMRVNLQGRGMLGFDSILSTEQGAETANSTSNYITALAEYRHDHPFIGMPSRLRSFAGPKFNTTTGLLKDASTIYCDTTVALSGCQDTPSVAATLLTPRKPYGFQAAEQASDLNATPLPSSVTTTWMDDWLNVTQIKTDVTGDYGGAGNRTYSRVTSNEYAAPNTAGNNWILGRLISASVTSTTPDDPTSDLLATSAGSAPYATANQGVATVGTPISPAQLMTILQLLLDD
jgi:hypothetical protein